MKRSHILLLILGVSLVGLSSYLFNSKNRVEERVALGDSEMKASGSVQKKLVSEGVIRSTSTKEVYASAELLDKIGREFSKLSSEDIDQLLAHIRSGKPDGVEANDWHYLVNAVLNASRSAQDLHDENKMAETLAYLAQSSEDVVIRLYALQHISFWYSKETKDDNKKLLEEALLSQSQQFGKTAGTAIQVMNDITLSEDKPRISSSLIDDSVLEALQNPQSTNDVKRTSILVCKERGLLKSLPILRNIAGDKSAQIHLRKVAIAAIRELGNKSDIDLLNSIHSEGGRITQATTPAIKKLSQL